jgi:hypothetical protein
MKITDPKLLHELYEVESERKLLIGYRFKGCLAPSTKKSGRRVAKKRRSPVRAKAGTSKRA